MKIEAPPIGRCSTRIMWDRDSEACGAPAVFRYHDGSVHCERCTKRDIDKWRDELKACEKQLREINAKLAAVEQHAVPCGWGCCIY